MKWTRGLWILAIFTFLYIAAFTIYYASILDYEFLLYIAVLVIIALVVVFTLDKSRLDTLALWGLSLWGLIHLIGGGVRINGVNVYRLRPIEIIDKGGEFFILKMDQVIHFYGFFVAAIVVYQLLAPHFKTTLKPKLAIFLACIGSMGLGALNEVIEFIAFISIEQTGVGDIYNIGLDLIFNAVGALFGSIFAHYWYKRKH